MTEEKRTPYQREMDEIHLRKEKADETLRMMLEENRRLRRQESGRSERRPVKRMQWFAAAAAAVACLVLVIGLTAGKPKYTFAAVQMSALTDTEWIRSTSAAGPSFEEAFARPAEKIFPGWEVTEEMAAVRQTDSSTVCEAELMLTRGERTLLVYVYDSEPAFWQAAGQEQNLESTAIRLARDSGTGALYAACRKDGLYLVIQGEMEENDFISILREWLRS